MARTRRPREETRAQILEVAQRRLREVGPGALRLDEIAAEIGISRQAILHHFESRAGLLRAVVEQAWTGLFRDLGGLVDSATLRPEEFVELVDVAARQKGNARLGAWLLLSEQGLPDEVFEGAGAALAQGLAGDEKLQDSPDAAYPMLLAGAALFGDAIFGHRLRQVLGLPDSEEERAHFRAWLATRMLRD